VTKPKGTGYTSYGSFGSVGGGFRLAFGGQKVGKLHSSKRIEQQPVSRPAGTAPHPRQGNEETCLTESITT